MRDVRSVHGPDVVGADRAAALQAVARGQLGPGAAVVVPGAEPGAGEVRLAEYPDVTRADNDGPADLPGEGPLDGPGAAVPPQGPGLGAAGRERPHIGGRRSPGRDDDLVGLPGELDLRPGRSAAPPGGRRSALVEGPATVLADRGDRGKTTERPVVHLLHDVPARRDRGRLGRTDQRWAGRGGRGREEGGRNDRGPANPVPVPADVLVWMAGPHGLQPRLTSAPNDGRHPLTPSLIKTADRQVRSCSGDCRSVTIGLSRRNVSEAAVTSGVVGRACRDRRPRGKGESDDRH